MVPWRHHVRVPVWVSDSDIGPSSAKTIYVPPDILPSLAARLATQYLFRIAALIFTLSTQRHVTRQKILNWKQSIKFPSRPKVSREGIDLMQQLLCEPEDRLGSQASASVNRPDSLLVQSRRSAFITPSGHNESVDGAHIIKVISTNVFWSFSLTPLRPTSGSVGLTGRIFTGIQPRIDPNFATLRTLVILTMIYPQR